jgi:lipid II isoglutaminyl synthase (glutamine-hydrolysing)
VRKTVGTLLGKTVAGAVRARGRSGGQALPGLVVETLIPGYLGVMLKQLPDGVVIITGTNGKTTTTKMVVELLRANGKRVLTNPTGSNLTRGIISSVSQQAKHSGKLSFDIAVFELDEAYARQFTDAIKPRYVLGLNASRDQLDRFGEVDKVALLIAEAMLSATRGIITNADDKRLSDAVAGAEIPVTYFGIARELLQYFPRDDELVAIDKPTSYLQAANVPLQVELLNFKGETATYRVGKEKITATLHVTGQHNFQNAAAALALTRTLLPDTTSSMLIEQLSEIRPAFGRGQTFRLKNGSTLQLNLVKNPASFRQGLASYVQPGTTLMIAINDRVADSKDTSWLWDVDFSSLRGHRITSTTGTRAVDMALRLRYEEIEVDIIETNVDQALERFCIQTGDKVVFATYTAMLHMHATLSRKAGKEL